MCGIAGIISKDSAQITIQSLKRMTDSISHRGPDGEGHWIAANGQVGIGHDKHKHDDGEAIHNQHELVIGLVR